MLAYIPSHVAVPMSDADLDGLFACRLRIALTGVIASNIIGFCRHRFGRLAVILLAVQPQFEFPALRAATVLMLPSDDSWCPC